MRILLINQHFYPDTAPTGMLLTDLAEDLAAEGHQVTVVTGRPGYTESDREKRAAKIHGTGIKVHRLPCTMFLRHSMFGRVLNYLSFYGLALWKVLSLPRAEVALIMTTPPLIYLLVFPLKYLRHTRVVHSVQDLYPDIAIALGVLKPSVWTQCLEWLAGRAYRSMDVLITLGNQMRQRFLAKGVPASKIFIVDNWIDQDRIGPIPHAANSFRKEQGWEDKFVVLYSGNMGRAHDFETIQKAMLLLRDHRVIQWVFIGGGVRQASLRTFIEEHALTNACMLPYQPLERLRYTLSSADASLLSMRQEAVGCLLPGKFYGILASGRPIIAICPRESEIADVLRQEPCGYQVDPGDAQTLADAILKLYEDKPLGMMMGQMARKLLLKRYERRIATQKYGWVLQQVGQSQSPEHP